MLSLLIEGQDFMENTTYTTSPVADEDAARCTTPPSGTERENQYLLIVSASVGQLSLGPSGNNPERSTTDSLSETHSKTHRWLLSSLGQPGQSVMGAPL